MTNASLAEALGELDAQTLAAMADVRVALQAKDPLTVVKFRQTLERAEQLCRQHAKSAPADHARKIDEVAEGIAAAGEILEEVCHSIDH
jgi:hypothetical protein